MHIRTILRKTPLKVYSNLNALFLFCFLVCLFVLVIGDGQLEVVGLENSLFVGQIIAGVRAHALRLAQCSSVIIR